MPVPNEVAQWLAAQAVPQNDPKYGQGIPNTQEGLMPGDPGYVPPKGVISSPMSGLGPHDKMVAPPYKDYMEADPQQKGKYLSTRQLKVSRA